MDESFPAKFFERDPNKIFDSYKKFIKSRSNAEGIIKNEDKLALTTISERFKNKDYSPDLNGFYKLYHDVKLVCTMLIHYYPQGTRNYQMVDKFYKFATELLLRECYRIGASFIEIDGGHDVGNENNDNELNQVIAHDFIKISTSYKVPLTQTYHIKTKDQDLFSSSIATSILDERLHELPNSNFELNKVIPQTNICEEAPRLGFVAANTSNIPDPTLPPTEMMTRFLHPNWYALPTTMWLKYGDYKSWAPSFTENGTVINSTARGIIWLERIGYTKIHKDVGHLQDDPSMDVDQKEHHKEDEEEGNVTNETFVSDEKKTSDILDENQDIGNNLKENNVSNCNGGTQENVETSNYNAVEAQEDRNDSLSIKLENLLDWSPGSYIDDDEIEHLREGTHSKLVTEILLKMKRLRKERILNKVKKPSSEEIKSYYKVRRILKEVLLDKQTSGLPSRHCKSFPVLQANYNGSIPVMRVQPSRKRKSKK